MEITNFVVRKDMRNQGIGNTLLNELIKLTIDSKMNTIFLEVNSNNFSAIKLYEKNGFKQVIL